MRIRPRLLAGMILPVLALSPLAPASAQSTDGYHAIQVLPVAVHTASFTQRFSLHNPNLTSVTLTPTYYPAEGTAEPAPSTCPTITVTGLTSVSFTDLRQICPALAAGSMFGTLVLHSATSRPFAVYSRVSNAAGAGFSVEGFPAHVFSASATAVSGLRRQAATADSPAYQSNCFVGNLGEATPGTSPVPTEVTLALSQAGVPIGSTLVPLVPGKLVRLLDVFAAVGNADGEFDNALATFTPAPGSRAGVLSFCTVQDNTSFGADFRIGKQLQGYGVFQNAFDVSNIREVLVGAMLQFNGLTPSVRTFEIPVGASANTHLLYFRHPDIIGCIVAVPNGSAQVLESYGLEMRLLSRVNGSPSWEVFAGGNNITGFSGLYLGDKEERGNGANTTYMLQVESNGQNEAVARPYRIRCQSGSGHTLGEIIQTGGPVAF